MPTQQAEQLAIAISNKTTVAGAGTAIVTGTAEQAGLVQYLGENAQEIAALGALGGFACAFVGLLVSIWFQWRRDRRESVDHQRRSSDNA